MRNTSTVTIKYGRNFRTRMIGLMHKAGLFRIVHYVPLIDETCEEIGMLATVEGPAPVRFLLGRLFKVEPGMAFKLTA